MTTTTLTRSNKQGSHLSALWLGDLHLDKANAQNREKLLDTIHSTKSDCVIVSGDVSNSFYLQDHLTDLASACWPRQLYFVPGNHDYHGSSFAETEQVLEQVTKRIANFQYLNGKEIIPLGRGTCLIGLGGWADGRAGHGQHTVIDTPDRHAIHDFRGMGRQQALQKMTELGRISAASIRKILPLALTQYEHVVIATHVPPYPTAVRYNGQPCGHAHLPHFSNLSAGLAIFGIARAFSHRHITILAAHSHSGCIQNIQPNIAIRVGNARTGRPSVFELLKL